MVKPFPYSVSRIRWANWVLRLGGKFAETGGSDLRALGDRGNSEEFTQVSRGSFFLDL